MGSIVLYIIEWAFALLVLLGIYKAAFSGTTLFRFNRFYLLGATLLSALLPLVHVTIPDSTPLVNSLSIQETEFAQELSGTFTFMEEPQLEITESVLPAKKTSLWAVMLVGSYTVYVVILVIGWSRGIIRARKFLRGKPRRRLSRTVWLVTHNEQYGPFSWMNYIVISDTESGFSRRASLRHEYSHVKLLHSADLVFLLACTTVNPVCWLVLQEIKIVHEFEADDQVLNRYGIHEQDYQRLLIMKAVGAEAYALASSFNLNIKKRIIMMNKTKTLKRRLMWLLLLIPLLGVTSVLFARSEKSLDIDPLGITIGTVNVSDKTFSVKVVDEKGKPVEGAMVHQSNSGKLNGQSEPVVVSTIFHGFTNKNGELTFSTPDGYGDIGITKDGYTAWRKAAEGLEQNLTVTLSKCEPGHETESVKPVFFIKGRNMMRIIVLKNGKVHVSNGVVNKDINPNKLVELIKQFVVNPKNDDRLPSIEEYNIEDFKTVNTTIKHVIELERGEGASYEMRDEIFDLIKEAYQEVRDEWCRKEFGKGYYECTPEQQMYSRAMYARKVMSPEYRYECGLKIRVRKDAMTVSIGRRDVKSQQKATLPGDDERLIVPVEELEKYIREITKGGISNILTVTMTIYPNAEQGYISDIKEVLRKLNMTNIRYEAATSERYSDGNSSSMRVSGVKPEAGQIITGTVRDFDGNPMTMVNVYEKDDAGHIYAHSVSDINGDFAFRLVDPNHHIEVAYQDYLKAKGEFNGNNISVTLRKEGQIQTESPKAPPAPSNNNQESGPDENGIYALADVDDVPSFPGGIPELSNYLSKNINYPAQAKEKKIQGRVLLSFIVNEDGKLSDIKVDRSADPQLDAEAVRVFSNMPNWKPGSNKGFPVKVRQTFPVTFRLN